jgi:rhamnose utilization protein RhaD (predicted bifunctional aldolase and dehydrogenase)
MMTTWNPLAGLVSMLAVLIRAFGRRRTVTARAEFLAILPALTARSSDGTFTVEDVVRELARRGSRCPDSTIRTHVVSRMCSNAPDHHAVTYDDLERVGDGRYRRRAA